MDRLAPGARNGNPPSPLYGAENPLGSYFTMPTAAMYSPAGGSGTRRESNASSSSSESTSDDDSSSSSASRSFLPHVTRSHLHGSKSSTHAYMGCATSSSSASSSSLSSSVSARSPSALAASVSTAPIVTGDDDDDAAPIQPLPMHLPRPKTKQDRDRERAAGRGPLNAGVKREGLGTRLARKRADSLKWAKYANVATFQVELGLSNDELRSG